QPVSVDLVERAGELLHQIDQLRFRRMLVLDQIRQRLSADAVGDQIGTPVRFAIPAHAEQRRMAETGEPRSLPSESPALLSQIGRRTFPGIDLHPQGTITPPRTKQRLVMTLAEDVEQLESGDGWKLHRAIAKQSSCRARLDPSPLSQLRVDRR